jgi:hypothetical protein
MSIRSMQEGSENGGSPDDDSPKGRGVSGGKKKTQHEKTHDAVDGLMTADGNQHQVKTAIKPDSGSPIKYSAPNGERRKSKRRKNDVGLNDQAPDETNGEQNPDDAGGAGGGTNKKDPQVMFKDTPENHGDSSPQHSHESIDDNVTDINDIKGNNR